MKLQWVISILTVAVVAYAGWYFYSQNKAAAPALPSTNAGVNGATDQSATGQSTNDQVQQQPMADGAEGVIIGANLALGLDGAGSATHLIGYTGMTVYTKDGDSAKASTCYGSCATNWPPYLVGPEDNVNQLKAGVNGKVDTLIRTDGGIQVTYNGKPLYFYASDSASGDVKGDGVGGVWHVAKP